MKHTQRIIQFLVVIGIVLMVNVIASYFHGYIDLTEEKRYTLANSTEQVIDQIDDNMFIRVLLEGEFPAGFKRLQGATRELLDDFQDLNPSIQYTFEDPLEGTSDEVKARRDQLAKEGIVPIALKYFDGKEYVQKGMYPYAIISYKGRMFPVSLLKEQNIGEDEEVTLNKSIELLEYKFANIFQKLSLDNKQNIAFTDGHGELDFQQTYILSAELRNHYNVGRLNLDSLITIDPSIDLLIIANPTQPFNEKTQFKIDQYVMNGGKIIYFLEKLDAHLDSINKYRFYVPNDIETNLDDLLFKYGARIQPNLVLDLESSAIPQIVGSQDGEPQTMLYKWYYHPLAIPNQNHPIGKNIDRVNLTFPSSIDTVKTKNNIKKTPILTTSPYSRYQLNPVRLNFEILKYPPETSQFNKGNQTLGLLLEGKFTSVFKNRITPGFQEALDKLNVTFKEESPETKQVVFTDADFIKNIINLKDNRPQPIGYNKWERKVYDGNKDFILNTIEYMLDDGGVLSSRAKQVKLRLLDAVKTKQERKKWQFINIGLPLLFLLAFGLIFNYIRKRKYSQ